MPSYLITPDQQAMQEAAARFARERLAPDYQKRETSEAIDRGLMREMGSLGLIGVDLSERYGGMGLGSATAGIIIEQLAYGDFNVAYVQLLASLMG
ncbi:MAG TPA: acyl-CoA dehydrogenase family protein, partial [Burkholderiaceae bacterium]|nr:acyl-CoA dehydrogenase family protein [Burkholderiaceae bacterium]